MSEINTFAKAAGDALADAFVAAVQQADDLHHFGAEEMQVEVLSVLLPDGRRLRVRVLLDWVLAS